MDQRSGHFVPKGVMRVLVSRAWDRPPGDRKADTDRAALGVCNHNADGFTGLIVTVFGVITRVLPKALLFDG